MKQEHAEILEEQRALKNQFHPAFYSAMELEFRENRNEILCESEHNLNTMPNRIDFLVIKKKEQTVLKSGLGAVFKKYNLLEYKSPNDSLGKKTYYKAIGYTNLYAANEEKVDSLEEMTVSFIRERTPRKLIKQFQEWGFTITAYEPGIYHVKKASHVDMQIIVTKELDAQYEWLKSLTDRLELCDVKRLAHHAGALVSEQDKIHARSVMDFVCNLNKNKEWMKEVTGMGMLRDLFKAEFEGQIEELTEENSKLIENLQSKDVQLQQKDIENSKLKEEIEQLQSKDVQLQQKDMENSKLKEEIEQLKKQLGKIAML